MDVIPQTPAAVLAYASPHLADSRLQSARTRGLITILLLLVTMIFMALSIATYYSQINLLEDAMWGVPITRAQGLANDQRIAVVTSSKLILFIATAIAFFFWLHRVTANLPVLGVRDARYSPGRAIGNFFIPVANLGLGYGSVAEVWSGSSADRKRANTVLVALWWLTWLAAGVLAQIAAAKLPPRAAPGQRPDLEGFISLSWMQIYSNVAYFIAGVFLMTIVHRINQMQALKFFANSSPSGPPVPYITPPRPAQLASPDILPPQADLP